MRRLPLFGLLLATIGVIGYGSVAISGWFKAKALRSLAADDWLSVKACADSLLPSCRYTETVEAIVRLDLLSVQQGVVAMLVLALTVLISQIINASTRSFIFLTLLLLTFSVVAQVTHIHFAESADYFVRSSLSAIDQDCLMERTASSCNDYPVRMQGIRYGAFIIANTGLALLAVASVPLAFALACSLATRKLADVD